MKTNFGKYLTCASMVLAGLLAGCKSEQAPDQPQEEVATISSKVIMRSCNVNGNEWAVLPDYPTEAEVAKVMEQIGNNTATVASFPEGCTEYIIQHVGGAHKKYSYVDYNGAKHDNIDGTSSQEFFRVQELDGTWQHVLNFNAGKCDNAATHNAALMDNGFMGAKTLNEYASSTIEAWRIFLIDGHYYLGIDFSAKKDDGEIQADGVFDDWVVKIIPLNGKKDPIKPVDPDTTIYGTPHVEFDIHQQTHTDWKEIKTSIHLRDTVDFTVLLPIPEVYQAESDDFDLRLGEKYEYLAHSITLVDKTYKINFTVVHKAAGIEIFVQGNTPECAEALRVARALYQDGLTFEVHTYVKNEATDEEVWNWLKQTQKPTVSLATNLFGQISSYFYPEETIHFTTE